MTESVVRYTSRTTNTQTVSAIHRVASAMRDRIETLGLDTMPNVTISSTGSWMESDNHATRDED